MKTETKMEGKCISITNDISRDHVQDLYEIELGMSKADFVVVKSGGQIKTLFISCPGCGDCSFTGRHRITENNGLYTVTPSIVFNCCKWHGYLTKNVFING